MVGYISRPVDKKRGVAIAAEMARFAKPDFPLLPHIVNIEQVGSITVDFKILRPPPA